MPLCVCVFDETEIARTREREAFCRLLAQTFSPFFLFSCTVAPLVTGAPSVVAKGCLSYRVKVFIFCCLGGREEEEERVHVDHAGTVDFNNALT